MVDFTLSVGDKVTIKPEFMLKSVMESTSIMITDGMLPFAGQTVTITGMYEFADEPYIKIVEDHGEWMWPYRAIAHRDRFYSEPTEEELLGLLYEATDSN